MPPRSHPQLLGHRSDGSKARREEVLMTSVESISAAREAAPEVVAGEVAGKPVDKVWAEPQIWHPPLKPGSYVAWDQTCLCGECPHAGGKWGLPRLAWTKSGAKYFNFWPKPQFFWNFF